MDSRGAETDTEAGEGVRRIKHTEFNSEARIKKQSYNPRTNTGNLTQLSIMMNVKLQYEGELY